MNFGVVWSLLFSCNLALPVIIKPNKSVKGTRRPLAVLKFGFYQGSAASLKFLERRAPYRNVRNKHMPSRYFKYKALSLESSGKLDERTKNQVIEPIVDSYYYLPTRKILNDPNEGIFKSLIQKDISALLQGLTAVGERNEVAQSLILFEKQLNDSTDNSGVFSLSHTATDELMWAHYCASHCGILIEYDINQLTRFSSTQHLHQFKVKYSERPPHLTLRDIHENPGSAAITMLGHKSPRWSYEEEFRVLLENMNGQVPHDYRAVKSITFGLNVPETARKQVFEATRHKVPSYYQIQQIRDSYDLNRVLLEEYTGAIPTGKKSGVVWEDQFEHISDIQKARLVKWAQSEIENDPHFKEFWMAEKSTVDPSKVVLQYESEHHLGLEPWTSNTKVYCEL